MKTTIDRKGQRYVYEPVYVTHHPKDAAQAVAAVFGHTLGTIHHHTHTNRVRLNWKVPDGKGGLKPRGK